MIPLKVTKEKMNGSSSYSSYSNEQSSSMESIMSAGEGETSVVATAVIGGMSSNVCVFFDLHQLQVTWSHYLRCVCSLTSLHWPLIADEHQRKGSVITGTLVTDSWNWNIDTCHSKVELEMYKSATQYTSQISVANKPALFSWRNKLSVKRWEAITAVSLKMIDIAL